MTPIKTPDFTSGHIQPGSVGDAIRHYIFAIAQTPKGFSMRFDKGPYTQSPLNSACDWLMAKGFIHKAFRCHMDIRFFVSKADAEAYKLSKALTTINLSSAAVPRKDVTIIWPDNVKRTERLMPPQRFQAVSLPGVHYGMGAMR